METPRVIRRLAAIVALDVVGFSRLIGVDEGGTLARFRATRCELIDPTIAACGARIVKTMGDGLLLEFPSTVDTLRVAIELQVELTEGEQARGGHRPRRAGDAPLPEPARALFRPSRQCSSPCLTNCRGDRRLGSL